MKIKIIIGIVILAAIVGIISIVKQNYIIILSIAGAITFVVILFFVIKKVAYIKKIRREQLSQNDQNKKSNNISYILKSALLTKCEKEFYDKILPIVKDRYYLLPQIPLSAIISKVSNSRYANELYRIIDFGIFTKDFIPLVLFEINDNTHNQPQRYMRDYKVKDILSKVNLPLITLWTNYENTPEYIEKRLKEYIEL